MDKAESFIALVIYPTTAEGQARQADNLVRLASEQLQSLPGLVRARVLLSEDGTSLLTLTEWRDRESFESFRESDFGRAASALMAELHPKAYWLRQHALIGSP
jgi:heme-degrading monooxygenase HmoA